MRRWAAMTMVGRRTFLLGGAATLLRHPPRRTVVVMCDGFGLDYLAASAMTTLARWREHGLYRAVAGVMPAVTNANNASICCGTWPAVHGITGNSYLDRRTGREEYMEDAALLRAPTLFERAARYGVKSALLSSKKKTIALLPRGADLLLAAETPTPEWVARLGPAPNIYSREINYWLLRAAIDLLSRRRDLGCLYVHTTDYPMHTWAPDAPESREHLARLDALLAEAAAAAPDAAFLLTGDHGMNHKSRCWDLAKACGARGVPIRLAISAERDRYLRHHQGFGGASWVYVDLPRDVDRVAAVLGGLRGVDEVLSRAEAARKYRLAADRIGDLAVFGDHDTVFGDLEAESEQLPATYRSHGSRFETAVPLFVYNAPAAPAADYFQHNLDLARWLYA
jgi:phosphonoacetate hydrolase